MIFVFFGKIEVKISRWYVWYFKNVWVLEYSDFGMVGMY